MRFPTLPEAQKLAREGDRYFHAGDRNEAIRFYNEGLKIEPNCVYILVRRGLALQENRLLDEAVRDYDQAISLDPEYGPAYYGRAWAKGWKGDYKGELKDAQKGFQLDPGNTGMYLRRFGSAYSGLNRFDEAIKAYSKAIEINPSDEGTIFNRALCYKKVEKYDLAMRDLDRALELDPDWDWAFFQKGLLHEDLGNFGEALNNYEKALLYSPRYEPALEGRSRVQKKFGRKPFGGTGVGGNPQKDGGCADTVFFILFCLIASPILLYLSIMSIHNENELRNRGLTTSALVTNSRIYEGNNGTAYEIQYRYSVDGGYTWYTCTDGTGRKNLWCSLTQAEWENARSKKQTTVKYLADRPWVNRLVYRDPPSSFSDNMGGLFLGVSPWIIFMMLGFVKKTRKP